MGANQEKWVQIKKNGCKSKLSKLAKITTFDNPITKDTTEVTNDNYETFRKCKIHWL